MTLARQLDALGRAWPDVTFAALGGRANGAHLDLAPLGRELAFFAAEASPGLCAQYLYLNRVAFPRLPLPAWVLSDLYLLPGAVLLVRGRADRLGRPLGEGLGSAPDADAILAAYVAVPSVEPGRFVGVSLMSFVPGLGAWAKTLGAKMLRARRLEGVTQWNSPSLRTHTRLGPMQVIGRVPGDHELAPSSFVYATDLTDESRWAAAMARELDLPSVGVPSHDAIALAARLDAAEAGEPVAIAPPGLRDGHVRFANGGST
jgi:hypothetical protein